MPMVQQMERLNCSADICESVESVVLLSNIQFENSIILLLESSALQTREPKSCRGKLALNLLYGQSQTEFGQRLHDVRRYLEKGSELLEGKENRIYPSSIQVISMVCISVKGIRAHSPPSNAQCKALCGYRESCV